MRFISRYISTVCLLLLLYSVEEYPLQDAENVFTRTDKHQDDAYHVYDHKRTYDL